MHPIKAFVGHSFTENDAHVVRAITSYLTTLQKTLPDFSWEHAEEPSPELVDSKVLNLLADKNVFIGICTKKERVISDSQLSPNWIFKGERKGKEEDFLWKTSDWIIQEIGLAIGRELKIILLVEEGVRTPGALQGNLEYISFRREAPEKAFDKLLGMISTLSPPSVGAQATAIQAPKQVDPQTGETANPLVGDEWIEPKADWKTSNFETAVMQSIFQEDGASVDKITHAFFQTEGQDEANRRHFLAWKEYLKIHFWHGGDISVLQQIADDSGDDDNGADAFDYLARSYEELDEFEKAAHAFGKAADKSEGATRIRLLGDAALAYEKAKAPSKVLLLEDLIRKDSEASGVGLLEVLMAQMKIAELRGEEEVALCAMEQILEIKPSDNEMRFSLAYKYSLQGFDELAALHYMKIPKLDRSAIAWNNLAVSLDRLQMPVKSMAAYRKSQKLGGTLAMSNIAIKFLDAGFLAEAKEILTSASQITDHHVNIDTTLVRTNDATTAEEEKEAAALAKAKPLSEFGRHVGRTLALPQKNDMEGSWQGPNCILNVKVVGSSFKASGKYEQAQLGLGFLGGLGGDGGQQQSVPYVIDYRGAVKGQAVFGTVTRRKEGETQKAPTSLLSSAADAPPSFSAWLSSDGKTLNVMERANSTATPRTYVFERPKHDPA